MSLSVLGMQLIDFVIIYDIGTQLKPQPEGFGEPLATQGTRWKNFYHSLDKKGGKSI